KGVLDQHGSCLAVVQAGIETRFSAAQPDDPGGKGDIGGAGIFLRAFGVAVADCNDFGLGTGACFGVNRKSHAVIMDDMDAVDDFSPGFVPDNADQAVFQVVKL